MIAMPHYTSIVTLLAVLFYFFLATRVPLARRRFNVQLPATTGHPDFERVFRAHQNTLEWMPIFLPSLWLCAIYSSDAFAAAVGVLWVLGRAVYYAGYARAVKSRLPGFAIQAAACLLLIVGAVIGLVSHFTTAA